MAKEFYGKWKVRKKKGGMKWVWKERKARPLTLLQDARTADSDHTTAPTTDGDVPPAA